MGQMRRIHLRSCAVTVLCCVYRLNAYFDADLRGEALKNLIFFTGTLLDISIAVGDFSDTPNCLIKILRGDDMADDRERNQGMKQGTGEGSGQHAPGRNPQDDRSAGQRGENQPDREKNQQGDFDPSRGGDGGSYKEGGQNEQTRR